MTAPTTEQLRARLEALAGGDPPSPFTVRALYHAFVAIQGPHYSPRPGCPNNELRNVELACRPMLKLYGDETAESFGAVALKTCGIQMAQAGGLCARTIRQRMKTIRRVFRWGVEREWLPPDQLRGLAAVRPIRPGEYGVKQPPPVEPVDEETVAATLPYLSPVSRILLSFLALTGARPGEACGLQGEWIDRSGQPWRAELPEHKTARVGGRRVILIGRRAQELISPLLRPGPIFLTKRRTTWRTDSLGTAVRRACLRAGVPGWSPNQLRHAAGTRALEEAGLAAAQDLLGHASPRSTATYTRTANAAQQYVLRHG